MLFKKTWLNWRAVVIDSRDLSFHAKGIALYLHSFMNDSHDWAFPSLRRIEYDLRTTRKTVIKYLNELEKAGFIKKSSQLSPRTNQHHNCYHALIPEKFLEIKGGGGDTPPTAINHD